VNLGIVFGGSMSLTEPAFCFAAAAPWPAPTLRLSDGAGALNVVCAMLAKGRSGRDVGNDALRLGSGRCAGVLAPELIDERLSDDEFRLEADSGDGECGAKWGTPDLIVCTRRGPRDAAYREACQHDCGRQRLLAHKLQV